MEPREVQTVQDARQIVEERGLSHVKIGLFDNDGVMRGKYMSREKFFLRSIMALAFATWCSVGICRISSTTISAIPTGTLPSLMPR